MRQICLPRCLIAATASTERRRLVLTVHVAAPRGETKQIKVLIDTGAEVNLIRPGIFQPDSFQQASKPLKLVTVSGSILQGGQKTIPLVFHLHGEHPQTGFKTHHLLGGLFYEADIGWDAIISYQLLRQQKIGVLPSRHCLMLDQGDHFILLKGGKPFQADCGNDDDWTTVQTNGFYIHQHPTPKKSLNKHPNAKQSHGKQLAPNDCHEHSGGDRNDCREHDVIHLHLADSKTRQETSKAAVRFGHWKTSDYAVAPGIVQQIVDRLNAGTPQVDCFATGQNKRFPQFWSTEQSAWDKHWGPEHNGLLWMNPPFDEIDRVVHKLKMDKGKAILVVPAWRKLSWWQDLRDIVVQKWRIPKQHGLFLQQGITPMPAPKWDVWAFLVDGGLEDMIHFNSKPFYKISVVTGVDDNDLDESQFLTCSEVHAIGERILVSQAKASIASVVKTLSLIHI